MSVKTVIPFLLMWKQLVLFNYFFYIRCLPILSQNVMEMCNIVHIHERPCGVIKSIMPTGSLQSLIAGFPKVKRRHRLLFLIQSPNRNDLYQWFSNNGLNSK